LADQSIHSGKGKVVRSCRHHCFSSGSVLHEAVVLLLGAEGDFAGIHSPASSLHWLHLLPPTLIMWYG